MIELGEITLVDLMTKVAIGGFLTGLVLYLDHRRRKESKNAHKKIIKTNLGKINGILEYITLGVSNMNEDRDETPSKLNQHMAKHHMHLESLIRDMQIQHAHCGKMTPQEDKMITGAINAAQLILDKYYRQDIPEPHRERVWAESHDDLHKHAKELIQAHNGM